MFRVLFVKLLQNRHPERSAPQIVRVTQRLWRGVEEPVPNVAEGTSAVLPLPMLLGAFRPLKPPRTENQELAARKEAEAHSRDHFRVQRPRTDLGMEHD
jgi:hypothetical protein